MEAKKQLATMIVDMFHSSDQSCSVTDRLFNLGASLSSQNPGMQARHHFESTFSQHQIPENIPEFKITSGQKVIDILVVMNMAASKNEARRLIKEKAVTHEGSAVSDENWVPVKGVLKIGKRRFLKFV